MQEERMCIKVLRLEGTFQVPEHDRRVCLDCREKHHELSQESRLEPNHAGPEDCVKDFEVFPNSSMLLLSCKQKSDMTMLALQTN